MDIRWRCVKHVDEAVVDMSKDNHPVVVQRDEGPCGYCGLASPANLVFKLTTGRCTECGRSSGHKMDCGQGRGGGLVL